MTGNQDEQGVVAAVEIVAAVESVVLSLEKISTKAAAEAEAATRVFRAAPWEDGVDRAYHLASARAERAEVAAQAARDCLAAALQTCSPQVMSALVAAKGA